MNPHAVRPSRELVEGSVVGRLRLERELGRGGMGVVFEATQLDGGRLVAVKVLAPEVAADERIQQRFRFEAMATARIAHRHVVDVLEYFHDERGTAYLVMELLYGESLVAWIEGAIERPLVERLAVVRQVLCGLDAAHAHGIVHRDVKPANVFLCATTPGEIHVKLIDFGVAKVNLGMPLHLTRTGKTVGTPGYMAPEQIRGGDVDLRADLYAAGCLAYLLLAGRELFSGDALKVMVAHLKQPPPPLVSYAPALGAFSSFLAVALHKRREDRYQSAAEMRDAFDACCRLVEGGGLGPRTLVDAPRLVEEDS